MSGPFPLLFQFVYNNAAAANTATTAAAASLTTSTLSSVSTASTVVMVQLLLLFRIPQAVHYVNHCTKETASHRM